jgi:hypothetical protein
MRPHIEQFNDLAPLSPFQSWPDCIINTSGYDFRKGQVLSAGQWPSHVCLEGESGHGIS